MEGAAGGGSWRPEQPATLVVGVGNEALRDEGVGLHVVRALEGVDLPPGVRVLEMGTVGWSLLGRLDGVQRLVLVDAITMGQTPGTVVTVRPEEIRRIAPADRTSLHGTSLLDVLELARALDLAPAETFIVGVEPAEIAAGFGLSPRLQKAVPGAVEAVVKAISHRQSAISVRPTADRG